MSQFEPGDVGMMIMATTFVMLQTPAMGIAQAGMIRRKNALSMLMQTLTGMCVGSVLWYAVGFALTFGETAGGFIGNPGGKYGLFFRGVPVTSHLPTAVAAADTIPGILMATFQMMFALMVPIIVTGAWAERMDFNAFLVFIVVWPCVVYYPLAHWVWNTGGWMAVWGVQDFAGGITIHTATGFAALGVTVSLQVRKGFQDMGQQHHNLPLSTLGAALIWGGWYSFNGGSAYKANFQAANALLNTHISACTAAITWSAAAWWGSKVVDEDTGEVVRGRRWQLSTIISGAFAGLAGVTAGSGLIPTHMAFVAGVVSGFAGFFAVRLKEHFELDDVLDVMALQGAPGFVGTVLVGFMCKADLVPCKSPGEGCCNAEGAGCGVDGLFFGGGWGPVGKQLIGAAIAAVWSFAWTYAVMKLIAATAGIDVSPEVEEKGLDMAQIGEMAYDHDIAGSGDVVGHDVLSEEAMAERLCDVAAQGSMVKLHRLLISHEARADAVDYDHRSPAHLAAAGGHLRILQELQRFGCPMDVADRWGNTPLKEAVENKRDAVIAWLRANGVAEVASSLCEQLCESAAEGDADTVKRLLAAGADANGGDYDKRTALHLAASEGHAGVVAELLAAGARKDCADRWGGTPLDDAQRGHHEGVVAALGSLAGGVGGGGGGGGSSGVGDSATFTLSTPLILDVAPQGKGQIQGGESLPFSTAERDAGAAELCTAANSNNMREVTRLLKKGADPTRGDYDGRTALHLAACAGHFAVLKTIMAARPTININPLDRWKQTPLSEALSHNHPEAAAMLRDAGGVIVDKKKGHALCAAAAKGDIAALCALRDAGTDVATADYDGRTALHLACSEGQSKVVQWLLIEGGQAATPNPTDRWGGTPLRDAIRNHHTKTSKLMRDVGGVEDAHTSLAVITGAVTSKSKSRSRSTSSAGATHADADGDVRGLRALVRHRSTPGGDARRGLARNASLDLDR